MGTRTYSRRRADGTRVLTAAGRAKFYQAAGVAETDIFGNPIEAGATPTEAEERANRKAIVNAQAQEVVKSATKQLSKAIKKSETTVGSRNVMPVIYRVTGVDVNSPRYLASPADFSNSIPFEHDVRDVYTGKLGSETQTAYKELYKAAAVYLSAALADAEETWTTREGRARLDATQRAVVLVDEALRAMEEPSAFVATQFLSTNRRTREIAGRFVMSPIASLADRVSRLMRVPSVGVPGSKDSDKFKERFIKAIQRLNKIESFAADGSVRGRVSMAQGGVSRRPTNNQIAQALNPKYSVYPDGSFIYAP